MCLNLDLQGPSLLLSFYVSFFFFFFAIFHLFCVSVFYCPPPPSMFGFFIALPFPLIFHRCFVNFLAPVGFIYRLSQFAWD
jgi:hypothetical protein